MPSVNELIGRLLQRADKDRLFGTAGNLNPCAPLQDSYGPLTNKLTRRESAELAVYLIDLAQRDKTSLDPQEKRNAEKFLKTVNAVAAELATSNLVVTPGGVLAAVDITTFQSAVTEAVTAATAKLTAAYTATPPVMTEFLDIGVAIGAAQIPLAGPFLAGYVMGGAQGAASVGFSAALVYTTNAHPGSLLPQVLPNESAALKAQQGVVKDVGKDMAKNFTPVANRDKKREEERKAANKKDEVLIASPKTHGFGLAWYMLARMKLKWTNQQIGAAAAGDMGLLMSSTGIGNMMDLANRAAINPQTRNQMCVTSTSRLIDTSKFESRQGDLKARLKSNYKSIEEFGEKLVQVQTALRTLLADILTVNVIRSFAEDLNIYIEEYEKVPGFAARNPNFVIRRGEAPDLNTRHTAVVAALIVSYFFMRATKVFAFRGNIKNNPPSALKTMADAGNTTIQAFRRLQKFEGQMPVSADEHWDVVKPTSLKYVTVLKGAIVDDLAAPFAYGSNSIGDIKKALKLFFACTMIVNDNASRKAAGAQGGMKAATVSTATNIPIDVIKLIAEAGFLTTYSTAFGTVSDDQKKKFTSGGKKLRWYDGKIKGASDSEKMMVYVFACIVLSVVDVTKLACGFQSWKATTDMLTSAIQEINRAEKTLDNWVEEPSDSVATQMMYARMMR